MQLGQSASDFYTELSITRSGLKLTRGVGLDVCKQLEVLLCLLIREAVEMPDLLMSV